MDEHDALVLRALQAEHRVSNALYFTWAWLWLAGACLAVLECC